MGDAQVLIAIVTTVGGIGIALIGAVVQMLKSKSEGVTNAHVQEVQQESVGGRTVKSQSELLADLSDEIDRLREDLTEDRREHKREMRELREEHKTEMAEIRNEIEEERGLKWLAIQHLRILYAWIARNVPGEAPPGVPEDLAPHVYVPRDHRSSKEN